MRRSIAYLVGLTLAVGSLSEPCVAEITYDASLNTLPESQGWSIYDIGTNAPPTISGGILYQNATADDSVKSFFAEDVELDFDGSVPIILEARLKIISSD